MRRAWHLVEPGKFVDNWHIGVLCEHLEACESRQIRKLIINIPPGCMKSLTVSVFYPVWCWLQDPSERFLFVSYAADVSDRDALRMRNIVTSDWFKERWGLRLLGVRRQRMFENSARGFRMSAAMGGQITGKHGHQTWVDDPIKPDDTIGGADKTRVKLHGARDFWRGTLYNRMAEPTRHVHGIMMQRLHDADLAGMLLEEGGYQHLMLPMRYEPKRSCVTMLGPVDKRTEEDELLWPTRFPLDVVKDLEGQLGPFAAAQMQQNPVPVTGGIFQRDWLKQYWSVDGTIPGTIPLPAMRDMLTLFSWDMAFKGREDSDRVAGGVWGRQGGKFFLIDQSLNTRSYAETKDEVRAFSARYPQVIMKLVEDKANGPAIVSDLQHDIPGFEEITPEGGKEARAWKASPLFRSGAVYLPHPSMVGYEWVTAYVEEMCRFPRGAHDDQVDQTTQALHYLHVNVPMFGDAMKALQNERKAAEQARIEASQAAEKAKIALPREGRDEGLVQSLLKKAVSAP